MSRGVLIKTCLLLAVTTHARAQYNDFFNAFLQPFVTTKPRNDVTKRPDTKYRQTNKQKYQDTIFFETEDFLKERENSKTIDPFNIHPTTAKPRRKSKSTTSQTYTYTTNKPKSVNSNKIVNNNNREVIRSVSNNDVDNRVINNARKIDNGYDAYNNYNVYQTTKATNIYGQNYDRQTSSTKLKTDYYGRQTTTYRPNYNNQYGQTTRNPLLNRPGVKPAAVDENRPPITNRPITERPYNRPFQSGTNRPPVEPRPVNTRPPFETQRPISTGVVMPVSGPETNEDIDIDIEIGPNEDDMSDAEKRRLYDVCEQKCEEYKAMRVRKVVALPLGGASARPAEVNVSSCAPDNVPLIIGGQPARIETFPHMALLGWKLIQGAGYSWKCGGSLVSERYVLTAGHCTYFDKDSNVLGGPPGAVQLGSAVYNDRTATVVRVELVVRHPKYKLRRSYYDVALLKLAVELTFSDTISPACLGVPPAVGEPVIATGWGKTEYGGDSAIMLRSVSIPIWDMGDCRDIWGTSLKLPNGPMPDNQVCAGDRKGAKDTCQGDSGGPAQIRDGCSWRVVAVTSVGRSCGAPETPALYARVPRAFIAKQVYTNVKPGRDGNNQYGNQGANGNHNGNSGNNNNGPGNNWNAGSNNNGAGNNWNSGNNNNGAGNYWNSASNNNGAGNNNWNSGNNNNGAGNNWNTGNNNGAGNNNWGTASSQNGNGGTTYTRDIQTGQNYNTAGKTPNNNQYYVNQGSTNNQGVVNSNNRNNNRGTNAENNNRYNENNRNVYDQSYNNGQTTNGYNQNNNNGQSNYNNPNIYASSGSNSQRENPSNTNYGTQSYNYNDNGSTNNGNNGYNRNNGGYSYYTVASKPLWS